MCFNIYWSGSWASVGLLATIYVHTTTSNTRLAAGVFFFFLMEFLQVVQYLFISPDLSSPVCDTLVNQVLTVLGWLHICMQPYFLHLMNEAMLPKKLITPEKFRFISGLYEVVKKLCVLGGLLLFARFPMSYIAGWNTLQGASTEWLRGNQLCTYKTLAMHHLGWSIPLADPTYNIMGIGLHCFLMFAPLVAMSPWNTPKLLYKSMAFQGAVLYFTGPFFASLITDNLQEQASVWCLFSIAQVSLMLVRMYSSVKENYPKSK